jgi:hypothetical protein
MKGSGTAIYVDGGSYRPNWLRTNEGRAELRCSFSVEVPEGEQWSASDEFRELVAEMVVRWSRSCYLKLQKRAKKDKSKHAIR